MITTRSKEDVFNIAAGRPLEPAPNLVDVKPGYLVIDSKGQDFGEIQTYVENRLLGVEVAIDIRPQLRGPLLPKEVQSWAREWNPELAEEMTNAHVGALVSYFDAATDPALPVALATANSETSKPFIRFGFIEGTDVIYPREWAYEAGTIPRSDYSVIGIYRSE